ncbi:hypothetical protein GEV33_004493 [Tenebrio molitor]|uniref:Uncharacterized protein n=1 Tax=Tenebrio molitor TaxID=7067 RepID=A0A8J6HRF6_TENMO|nr:hypothetical protein GEV33_004493 [Tenebrio molitor]
MRFEKYSTRVPLRSREAVGSEGEGWCGQIGVSFSVQFESETAPPKGSLVGQIALCGSKSLSPFGLVRNLAQHFLPFRVQALPQIKTHVYANRSTESDFLTRGSLAGPRFPSSERSLCEEGHGIKEWYSGADLIQSSPPPPEGHHSPAVKQPFFFLFSVLSRRGLVPR